MTQDELEDELFLAMLRRSREDGAHDFDLPEFAKLHGLNSDIHALVRFAKSNSGAYGKAHIGGSFVEFTISAEGLRHAKSIEDSRRPRSWADRLADDKFQKIGNISISALSLLISIGALVVAAIALFKPGN